MTPRAITFNREWCDEYIPQTERRRRNWRKYEAKASTKERKRQWYLKNRERILANIKEKKCSA